MFDQNLSPRLVEHMRDVFPESSHVTAVGLDRASDQAVREYAGLHGYILVTKDADFGEFNARSRPPTKVVWVRLGNCTTRQIADALRSVREAVEALGRDPEVNVLTVLPPLSATQTESESTSGR